MAPMEAVRGAMGEASRSAAPPVLHPLRFFAQVQQGVMRSERLGWHGPGLCLEGLESQEFRS